MYPSPSTRPTPDFLCGCCGFGDSCAGGEVVGWVGWAVGVKGVGEAGARIGVNVPVLDRPGREAVLLGDDPLDVAVGAFAEELARTPRPDSDENRGQNGG